MPFILSVLYYSCLLCWVSRVIQLCFSTVLSIAIYPGAPQLLMSLMFYVSLYLAIYLYLFFRCLVIFLLLFTLVVNAVCLFICGYLCLPLFQELFYRFAPLLLISLLLYISLYLGRIVYNRIKHSLSVCSSVTHFFEVLFLSLFS